MRVDNLLPILEWLSLTYHFYFDVGNKIGQTLTIVRYTVVIVVRQGRREECYVKRREENLL
jgi:hypothetical protein